MVAGQRPDSHRRVRRARHRDAGLRNGAAGDLRHDGERVDVGGAALVGRHAERSVTLQMLDGAEAFAFGEDDVRLGDVVLLIDERLAARAFHAPERRNGLALAAGGGNGDRSCRKARLRGRGRARRSARCQCLVEAERAGNRACDRHALAAARPAGSCGCSSSRRALSPDASRAGCWGSSRPRPRSDRSRG